MNVIELEEVKALGVVTVYKIDTILPLVLSEDGTVGHYLTVGPLTGRYDGHYLTVGPLTGRYSEALSYSWSSHRTVRWALSYRWSSHRTVQ